jgi:hypothetical protein
MTSLRAALGVYPKNNLQEAYLLASQVLRALQGARVMGLLNDSDPKSAILTVEDEEKKKKKI